MDRLLDERSLIEHGHEVRVQGRSETVELGVHAVRDVDHVRALRRHDLQREGRLAVHARDAALRHGLEVHVCEVRNANHLSLGVGDGQGLEILDRSNALTNRDRNLAVGARRLASGHRRPVRLQQGGDRGGLDLQSRDVCRAQVDHDALLFTAREFDALHAAYALQCGHDRLRELLAEVFVALRGAGADHHRGNAIGSAREHLALRVCRKNRLQPLDRVLHRAQRLVVVAPEFPLDLQLRRA